MSDQDGHSVRAALQRAKDDLLEGRVPGPLTASGSSRSPESSATASPTTIETSTTNFSNVRAN